MGRGMGGRARSARALNPLRTSQVTMEVPWGVVESGERGGGNGVGVTGVMVPSAGKGGREMAAVEKRD